MAMHISFDAAVSPTVTGDELVFSYVQLYVNESPCWTVRKFGEFHRPTSGFSQSVVLTMFIVWPPLT
jgi:hypothetical protein